MKKRDLYWVSRISAFLVITLIFGAISIFNIIQFNTTYMQEEREELQITKRQILWAIEPIIKKQDYKLLQKYCDDFKNEDVEFRIFDENKNLIASSNPDNQTPLLDKNSKILRKNYSKVRLYRYSIKDRKIGVREKFDFDNHKYYLEITVSQADVMKSIISAQKSALIFFVVCFFIFISGLVQIFSTLRNSFNKLEDSVIEVANGNLDTEIEIPKLGLLKELTLSVKKMTQRLRTQIAQLTQLEEYKNEFLQNIAHEIKTPITAINSAAELLETQNNLKQNDQECLDIIHCQVKTINNLINDILYLSEIESAKTEEDKTFEMFNLNKMIEKVIDEFNYSNMSINFIQNEPIMFCGNKELLSIALSNILTNAIKYSGSKKIDVILEKTDNGIELIVRDYGVGIQQEYLERIFERFYRIDKTRSRKLGGSGLGLSITKNIIELHRGTIKAESEINKGTSFIINF